MGSHYRELQQAHRKKRRRSWPSCELCQQQPASVYCPWDEARLCDLCDANVHSANFLVAKHSRHLLCPCCGDLHSSLTGPRIEPLRLQEPCAQCSLHTNACQRQLDAEAEALCSAESCCIDADQDRSSSSSASTLSPPKRLRSRLQPSGSTSAHASDLSQEEGLGDSEDGSYGFPSLQSSAPPPRRRRRLLRGAPAYPKAHVHYTSNAASTYSPSKGLADP